MKKTFTILLLFIFKGFTQDTNKIKGCVYKVYYHPDGKKKEEGCLIKGKKEGVWK